MQQNKAIQAVLGAVERQRAPFVDPDRLLKQARKYAAYACSGTLDEQRQSAVMAGAFSILAIEAIDEEMKG